MNDSQTAELDATIRELEASLAEAAPESRELLLRQLSALHDTRAMWVRLGPEMAAVRAARPALSPELRAFFTPDPIVPVPAWIPDHALAHQIPDGALSPTPGTRVYREDRSASVAIPGRHGESRAIAHGLALHFFHDGRLAAQRFYEQGLLRWSIDYHATGGRAHSGHYLARERFEYPEHGQHTRWSPGGAVIFQGYYREGRAHGWTRHWEEDGYPIGATLFVDGTARESVLPDGSRRG